jgi:hypothetical protein
LPAKPKSLHLFVHAGGQHRHLFSARFAHLLLGQWLRGGVAPRAEQQVARNARADRQANLRVRTQLV